MKCPACRHENRTGAKFCEECAAPLRHVCAACGSELRPAAKFCDECGAATTAQPQPSTSTRKVVTIVFADLVGSTALHERLDPEAVRQFMERYYATMRDAVEAHGGTVTQLLGDGVKAVFGAPRVAEDDAIRAVRAAVAMQHAFRELAAQQSDRVGTTGLRVAVNTGEVVADEATEIIGDPVNVAARLQEQGRDGDVVIGGTTERLVATLVTLERLGSFALKGRSEAVTAYRLVSLDRPVGATAAPFVGREIELARLEAVHAAAVTTPATRLVVLLGSPGLGKSRLIDELARRHAEGATILAAHCDAAGGATFAPLAQPLRGFLGLDDGAVGAPVRAAVAAALPAGDESERARIATGIDGLISGAPTSPEETFFVVRRFLAALASVKPVILVIDDLHWAEPLLLDLVEHLVQWGSGVPLFVLVGTRPELRGLRSSLVTPGGLVADVVTLGGLDAGAAMRLAASVIGASDLPAAVAAKVLATSEGNPLFVGELVRMLVQEGALTRDGERWTAGAGLAALEMPPTIQALLAARIERLRPEERTVLERAAVVGRHFSRSAVAALMPRDGGDLDARLESLRRSELIERDAGWLLGEPALRFHHVLIRDAAYRRLLKGTRAELHARLADWIEAQVADAPEHDETIGWHLEQAHQHLRELGPIDATGAALGERAANRLAAAGRRALARDDLPLAASLLGRAVARLTPDAPERADLVLDWCEALLSVGDIGPAAAAIDELGRLADSDRLRAWHTCFAGQLTVLTAPEGLRATADRVGAAARDMAAQGDAAGEAKAHFVHAQALARLGKVGACEAALDQALAAARRAGDRRRANAVLAGAPLAALWGPSPVTRASGRCLDVVRVLRITQGAPAVEAVALSCQGVLEALRGRTDAARRMIASSRKMVEELGIAHRVLETDVFAGRIDLLEGDMAAAERGLRRAYDGLRELGLGIDAARAAALLARALLAQGKAPEAEALSRESEQLAGDDLQAAIAWRGVRAEAMAERGEHAAAVELAQSAVAIAATTDALLDHADARLALAAALRAAGRGGEAEAEKLRAIELWEAKGATYLAERARKETGRGSIPRATEARIEPKRAVQRRVRPNAATAAQVQFDVAFASGDLAAIEAAFVHSPGVQVVDHPTESRYGREGAIDSYRRMLHVKDPIVRHEPLATLGDSLGLFRRHISSGGTTGGRFDVGDYQREEFVVTEPGVVIEVFAANRLADAVACLYGRYAELLPDGPERRRAAVIARSVPALCATDPERLAAALAPSYLSVDHRALRTWSARDAAELLGHFRLQRDLAPDFTYRLEDVLALEPHALVTHGTYLGTDRATGGRFENRVCVIFDFGVDGLVTRGDTFEAESMAEALARFDELTAASAPACSVRRRLRANAATKCGDLLQTAIAGHDADAFAAQLGERLEFVHHPTRTTFGRSGTVATWRSLLRAERLTYRRESLATLGDSLALDRQLINVEGLAERHLSSVGAVEVEEILLTEVDGHGRVSRFEVFAADRLGDALARLYERYAESLRAGQERERAATTARAVASLRDGPLDLDRWATAHSPALVAIDHRILGSWSAHGREAVQAHFLSLLELASDVVFHVDDVLAVAPDAFLLRRTHSGCDRAGGGTYERPLLLLGICDPDGLVARLEFFDVDRAAEALARFDELRTLVHRRVRPNAASALTARFQAAFAAGDEEVLADLFATPLEVVDHPNGASYSREGHLASVRRLRRARDPVLRFEPIATLGEELLLSRRHITASGTGSDRFDVGAYERDEIVLFGVEENRFRRIDIFAADHLIEALMGFYEGYAATFPPGPARERAAVTARSIGGMFLELVDRARLANPFSPAVEWVDHRVAGVGVLRGDVAVLAAVGAFLDLARDVRWRIDEVMACSANALLTRGTNFGVDRAGGGAFERAIHSLVVFGADGLITRWETFESTHEAEAIARFDALVDSDAAPTLLSAASRFTNSAARMVDAISAYFEAHDWPRFTQRFSEEFRYLDRRRMALLDLDRDQYVAFTREMGDGRAIRGRNEILATRGERLALARYRVEFTDDDVGPSEIEFVTVIEVDERDLGVVFVRFDADDLDAAYAELDARHEAREGTADRAHGLTIRALSGEVASRDWEQALSRPFSNAATRFNERLTRAWVARDWDAVATLHTAAVQMDDRRRLLQMRYPAETSMAQLRFYFDVPGSRWVITPIATRGERLALSRILFEGEVEGGGGALAIDYLAIDEVDADGGSVAVILFDLDDLDAAHAELNARYDAGKGAASPVSGRFENAATRATDRFTKRFHARDWTGVGAAVDPTLRFDDRRRIMRLQAGAEDFLTGTRMLFDVPGSRWEVRLLATRGRCSSLNRMRFVGTVAGGGGPLADEHLCVAEVGADDHFVAIVLFDSNDLDAAYAELDARWEAGEGAQHVLAASLLRDFAVAQGRRDWDAVATCYAPQFVGHDHRLVGWGTLRGPAAFLATLQEMAALAPDARMRTDHVRTSSRGILAANIWVGTRDGGAFESPFIVVIELDAQGRAARHDFYDVRHADAALARFEEIRASTASGPFAAIVKGNAATATVERWQVFDAGVEADWDALRASCAPGVVFEDRQGFARLSGDREMMIASLRERVASGARAEARLLGTAGERVAVTRMLWSGGPSDGRFEIEYVGVVEVDEAGLLTASILFGAGDARAAQREAWARWAAIDPAAAPWVTIVGAAVDGFDAHDAKRLRALFADDVVVDDHRRTGFGRIEGADAYLQSLAVLWDLAPDQRMELGWFWPAVERHGVITVLRRAGTLHDGGAFESECLWLSTASCGRMTRLELFEIEDLDEAVARLAELRPDPRA